MSNRAVNFLKLIYTKLVRINDSPHKVAAGFGLGVFAGIMPFAGPLLAVFLAIIFKVNKASALLAGFVTNTWISWLAFFFSIKVGSVVFGINSDVIRSRWLDLLKNFHLSKLFNLSVLEIMLPVVTGYFVIAVFSALLAYVIISIVMNIIKLKREGQAEK